MHESLCPAAMTASSSRPTLSFDRPAAFARPPATANDVKSIASNPKRDRRLDLFRGLALLLIFIDHIPDNFLTYFTLRSLTISDAAEIFVFISGFVAALVYGRVLAREGLVAATLRIWKRGVTIFVAHILLLGCFLAEVSLWVQYTGHPGYNDQLHISEFLADPNRGILKALSLQYQPTYLDILPIYVLMMAVFPAVLWLVRKSWPAALAASLALYIGVQIWHWNLPGFPSDRSWYFDPLAWQVLFVGGAVLSHISDQAAEATRRNRWIFGIAAMIVAIGAVSQLSMVLHGVWPALPGMPYSAIVMDKTYLAPLRVVNFAALVFVVARLLKRDAPLLSAKILQPIIRCGEHSLPVFCGTVLLALAGNVIVHEFSHSFVMQLCINLVGGGLLIALAYGLSWVQVLAKRRHKLSAEALRLALYPRPFIIAKTMPLPANASPLRDDRSALEIA